jgi:hypothetical protein
MRVFAEGIVGIAMATTKPKLAMAIAVLDMDVFPFFTARRHFLTLRKVGNHIRRRLSL